MVWKRPSLGRIEKIKQRTKGEMVEKRFDSEILNVEYRRRRRRK